MNDRYIVVLEISSSRISAVAATIDSVGDTKEVCHFEEVVNGCVRYGAIINVEEVSSKGAALIAKIQKHPKIAPRKAEGVFVGVNARSLHSETVRIEKTLNDDAPISEALMDNIRREAKSQFTDVDILAIEPLLYEVDGKEVAVPVGTLGSHFVASFTVVVCKPQVRRNLKMVLDKQGLELKGYIPTPLALSKLLLTDSERRLGCMLVDHGADTTSVSIYKNNKLIHLAVLPMGSRNITRDLMVLNVLEENAERIKKTYGIASLDDVPDTEISTGVRSIDVINYISSRAGEIVENVANQIKIADMTDKQLPAGIVAAGRGFRLKGLKERLHDCTNLEVHEGLIAGLPSDAEYNNRLGVLAILDSASEQMGIEESCLKMPEMPDPEPLPDPEPQPEPVPKPKKKSIVGRFFEKLSKGTDTIFGEE